MTPRTVRCPRCDQFGPHKARGWCRRCYLRWIKAGQPEGGPPPALTREECAARARAAYQEQARGRREDYQELRSWGETREMAAQRVGVTERTAWRYERALRELVAAAGEAGQP